MPSYLLSILLATSFTNPVPPLADQKGFDRCVAEVNANPELGGDSDYLHCDTQHDPYLILYTDERFPEQQDGRKEPPLIYVEEPVVKGVDVSGNPRVNYETINRANLRLESFK